MARIDITKFIKLNNVRSGDYLLGVESTVASEESTGLGRGFIVPVTNIAWESSVSNLSLRVSSIESSLKVNQNIAWSDLTSSYFSTCKYRVHNNIVFILFSGQNLTSQATLPTLFTMPTMARPSIALLFSATLENRGTTNPTSYSVPIQINTNGQVRLTINPTAMWNAANALHGSFSYPI